MASLNESSLCLSSWQSEKLTIEASEGRISEASELIISTKKMIENLINIIKISNNIDFYIIKMLRLGAR